MHFHSSFPFGNVFVVVPKEKHLLPYIIQNTYMRHVLKGGTKLVTKRTVRCIQELHFFIIMKQLWANLSIQVTRDFHINEYCTLFVCKELGCNLCHLSVAKMGFAMQEKKLFFFSLMHYLYVYLCVCLLISPFCFSSISCALKLAFGLLCHHHYHGLSLVKYHYTIASRESCLMYQRVPGRVWPIPTLSKPLVKLR